MTPWYGLPTDNLYKFVAIFGLLILLAGNYFLLTKIIESDIEITEIGEDLEYLEQRLGPEIDSMLENIKASESLAKTEKAAEEARKLELAARKLLEEVRELQAKGTDRETIGKIRKRADNIEHLLYETETDLIIAKDQIEEKMQRLDEIRNKLEKHGEILRQISRKNTLLGVKVDHEEEFKRLMNIGNVVGLGLIVVGFSLWYTKVQKYMDLRIKNETLGRQQTRRISGLRTRRSKKVKQRRK